MSDLAEEATLLLEPCPVPGVIGVHQGGVKEFGCTGQLVERGLTRLSVCSSVLRVASRIRQLQC